VVKTKKPVVYVETDDGCHIVKSHCKHPDGYIYVSWKGSSQRRLHRWVYEQEHGKIPDGLVVRHKCDNPSCINLEHMELGTQQENVKDMVERNRVANHNGELNPNATLTEQDVRDIKASKEGSNALGRCYGVDRTVIWKIRTGRLWAHVQ
jgi:hypothetical protein